MRMLTLDEVGFVSGGDGDDEPMQEVVVQGKRIIDWPLRYYLSEDTGGGRFAGDGGGGEVLEEVVIEAPSEMSPEELLKFWESLLAGMSPAKQAALAAALLAAAKNSFLSPHSQALAALSGAVSAGNVNMAADIHYAANDQGYGLAMDGAIKGALDRVRGGR